MAAATGHDTNLPHGPGMQNTGRVGQFDRGRGPADSGMRTCLLWLIQRGQQLPGTLNLSRVRIACDDPL